MRTQSRTVARRGGAVAATIAVATALSTTVAVATPPVPLLASS